MYLNTELLARHGYALEVRYKTEEDTGYETREVESVQIMPADEHGNGSFDHSTHDHVKEILREKFPMVDHDTMLGIAHTAVQSAMSQDILRICLLGK
jgi:hypothetical protein